MISKSIGEGFRFAFSVKRILPYLIMNLIMAYILIGFFRDVANIIMTEVGIPSLLLSLGIYLPTFIIIGLIHLWIKGAIIDQARYFPREKSLIKSFEYSTSKYLTIFCAAILYVILAMIVSFPPYIGAFLSFILSLALYYLYPAIMVDKRGCIKSFKRSYKVFLKYPLETFVTWLVVVVISFIIIGIFTLPLMFYLIGNVFDILQPVEPFEMEVRAKYLIRPLIQRILASVYSPYFIPYIFLICLALAFNMAFQVGTQTRLYINSRRIEA